MSALDGLIACAGAWRGRSRLEDPGHIEPDESESTLAIHPALGGRFVRVDYTWAYRGAPQEGSLLLGHLPAQDVVTGHWIDTWHMGRAAMACEGAAQGAGVLLRGSYAAPPGPDWGWRIGLAPQGEDGGALRLWMVNVTPEGEECPAVEAVYRRA